MKISNKIEPSGKFFVEHWRKGSMIDRYDMPNSVTIEGKNNILRTNFYNGTQILRTYMSLIDNVGYVSLSTLDTYQGLNHYSDISDPTVPYWQYYWKYRKAITIDNTNVGTDDLTDFPLCVRINSDADFSNATSTGYDIRFTSSDGITLLSYEREYWSGGNGTPATAVFWVKVPTIQYNTTTTIYIYYGNNLAVDGEDAENVWESSYKGVWHLSESGTGAVGDFVDSTINGNDSTNTTNQPVQFAGQIGWGKKFNLSQAQSIIIPNNASLTIPDVTMSAWVNPLNTTVASGSNIIGFDSGYILEVGRNSSGKIGAYLYLNNSWRSFSFGYAITLAAWTHLAVTYDSSTGDATLYVNGAANSTINYAGNYDIAHAPWTSNIIGGNPSDLFYSGAIDEVRISSAIRTDDWIKFEYYNQSSVTNELTWGAHTTLSGVGGNNWLEFTGYSDPNSNGDTNTRPVWYTDEASGQTIANTTKSLFDITESCTIVGLLVVTGPNSQIKGDNSAGNSLWATALFLKGNVILEVADQLRIIYTIAT